MKFGINQEQYLLHLPWYFLDTLISYLWQEWVIIFHEKKKFAAIFKIKKPSKLGMHKVVKLFQFATCSVFTNVHLDCIILLGLTPSVCKLSQILMWTMILAWTIHGYKAVPLLSRVLKTCYHLPEGPRSEHVGVQHLGSAVEVIRCFSRAVQPYQSVLQSWRNAEQKIIFRIFGLWRGWILQGFCFLWR